MEPGFRKEVEELCLDGGKKTVHYWRIVQWGRVVAKGAASTEDKAEALMASALSARVSRLQASGDKKKEHAARIRYHLKRRPYVCVGMVRMLMGGIANQETLMREAQMQEEREWNSNPDKDKKPLKREAGSGRQPMEASKVVEQMWESMAVMGYIQDEDGMEIKFTSKGRRWALQMFGPEEFGMER